MQGPAELLPISSSAHTALIPWLGRWSYCELPPETRKDFEVALHAGAGAAIAMRMAAEAGAAYRNERGRAGLLVASIASPALAGLAFERPIERRLGGPVSISIALLAGALAMALADRRPPEGTRAAHADWRDGLALGLAQALALAPGVSRNGATLVAARARGFGRADARELSWAVGLPVVVGPVLLRGRRLAAGRESLSAAALGAGAAFASSWLAAGALRSPRLREASLLPYALYRALLAAIALIVRRRRAQ